MAWNEPGKDDKDPWGSNNRGNKNDGPPDLDEVIRNIQQKLSGLFGGNSNNNSSEAPSGPSSFIGLGLVATVLLLVWLASGIYIVEPAERGVILQFGKYKETVQPGPHWHLPAPLQTVEVVDVDKSRTATIGFRSSGARDNTVASEALMLTKDENIIEMKVEIQYRVDNAADFLFHVDNPVGTLEKMTESAVREVVGQSSMDQAINERAEVKQKAEKLLQSLLNDYGTGLIVTSFNIKDTQPPAQVQAAFSDVVKASADKERMKNEAQAYANDIVPKARGAAFRLVQEAEAYKSQVLSKAKGDTSRFLQVMTEYEKAPEITRERLYLDTMESVYSRTQKVMVDVSKDSSNVLYLPLDKMRGGSTAPKYIDQSDVNSTSSHSQVSHPAPMRDDARSRGGR
mgnify:CR=1 FL=1